MNNKHNYKELIEQFTEEKGYNDKQKRYLLRPEVYEKQLFELMPYQLGNLVINDMCGLADKSRSAKNKSATYLEANYYYLKGFYDWSVKNGLIPYNPFQELETLSYENLLYQMTEQVKVTVLYEDDLEKYVRKVKYNRELYALILGLLFDGVANNKELASINFSDIKSNELTVNNRVIQLSIFTQEAISKYKNIDTYYIEKPRWVEKETYIQHKDFLFKKVGKYYKPEDSDEKYIQHCALTIGTLLKKIDLSYFDVTRSGLINSLRKEFKELTDKDFCNLFIPKDEGCLNRGETSKIKKVLKIYGGSSDITAVMNNCFPYIINSKYC